jgi:hypothetical protein
MFVMSIKVFIMLDSWGTHTVQKFKRINKKNATETDQNSNTIKKKKIFFFFIDQNSNTIKIINNFLKPEKRKPKL